LLHVRDLRCKRGVVLELALKRAVQLLKAEELGCDILQFITRLVILFGGSRQIVH